MSVSCCSLDLDTSVNDVLRCHPAAVRAFNAFGVDACCGGAASLRDAARDAGLLPETLLFAVRSVITNAADAAGETR
jgi:regulator of cell morphogenesis and NO signaling